MFGVECFDTHDEPISHYTQWDINQTLKIVLYGMDDGYMKNAPYVHFANIKRSEALVVRSTLQGDDTVLVDIPNQLLQESYPLLIYVYLNDSSDASSQRTIVKIEIPVHKRARPSDYEYVENIDKITAEVIKQEIYDDVMDEVHGGNIAYPYVTFIDESTGKHVNLKVSDEKFGLYVDSTNRQLLDTGDIVNNLMTNSSTKALSASMGATIKNMVDVIPDNIDEKIEEHDSSPTSHSDIRDSITEIENKIDDIMLDDTISGSGILTTTDTLVDSSPIEMRIKGNTVQNLWVNPSGTSGGVTVTSNADGSMTISGTSTGDFYIYSTIYSLKPGSTYTLSIDKDIRANISIQAYNSDGYISDIASIGSNGHSTNKAVLPQNATYARLMIQGTAGRTLSGTYRVMLNEGSEPEPWCPPGLNSVDELSLVCAGKNLLEPQAYLGNYTYGIALGIRDAERRTEISLPHTTAGSYQGVAFYFEAKAGNSYTFTQHNAPAGAVLKLQQFYPKQESVSATGTGKYTGVYAVGSFSSGATFTFENDGLVVVLSALEGTGTATWPADFSMQLELGSTATSYEPPAVTTTPIDLDGNILCSLPDGTHDELTIDATGAVTLTKRVGVFEATEDTSWSGYSGSGNVNAYYTNTGMDAHAPTGDTVNAVDTKMMCDDFPCYQTLWHTNVATPRVGISDNAMYTNAMFYNSAGYGPAASDTRMTVLYPLATPKTIPLTAVTLPSFPSDKSNIYTTSNVPTAGLTVRYWKKGGELVANLYKLLRNHEA